MRKDKTPFPFLLVHFLLFNFLPFFLLALFPLLFNPTLLYFLPFSFLPSLLPSLPPSLSLLPLQRAQLYSDMTHSLYEVRQLVAENVVKVKEKLRVQGAEEGTPSVAMVTALKGEGSKVIQDENAQLNKMVHMIW